MKYKHGSNMYKHVQGEFHLMGKVDKVLMSICIPRMSLNVYPY